MNRLAMITANTALTIRSRKKITNRKSTRARSPMIDCVRVPIELPLCRVEIHRAAKSCTAPANTVPSTTQRNAGSHPQITAIAGPTIGAAPATEVKWCPKSTCLLVGT
jgi:hypothetical protein